MCLGIPGRVIERHDDDALPMGVVDFGGVRRDVCLAYTPEVAIDDFVIVHVGFAISVVDEVEAERTYALLSEAQLADELGTPTDTARAP
ncbi:MAG: HypC/HybG/HupF family hydrogenase formation chaperone [Acidimicrobiia bacterium]|nr:HypC/HybG/HupF family hydrogenase formation chaperone [Acidimicrobiia bacterium]